MINSIPVDINRVCRLCDHSGTGAFPDVHLNPCAASWHCWVLVSIQTSSAVSKKDLLKKRLRNRKRLLSTQILLLPAVQQEDCATGPLVAHVGATDRCRNRIPHIHGIPHYSQICVAKSDP